MYNLPIETQRHIYEFDPTYHEKFKKILDIIPFWRDIHGKLWKNISTPTEWDNDKDSIFYFDSYTGKWDDVWTYDEYLFQCGYEMCGEQLKIL
jgi:hypothetical protein